jgi:uncharacterized protein (TIGR03067 family)
MTIIGKWKIVEAELGAQKLPLDSLGKLVLEMDETSYQVIEGKVIESGMVELLEGSSPKALLIKAVHGPNAGKTFQCIYRFDGPDMIMCYNLGGDGMPEQFSTKDHSLLYLVRYRSI